MRALTVIEDGDCDNEGGRVLVIAVGNRDDSRSGGSHTGRRNCDMLEVAGELVVAETMGVAALVSMVTGVVAIMVVVAVVSLMTIVLTGMVVLAIVW